jgi:hypothetical protein
MEEAAGPGIACIRYRGLDDLRAVEASILLHHRVERPTPSPEWATGHIEVKTHIEAGRLVLRLFRDHSLPPDRRDRWDLSQLMVTKESLVIQGPGHDLRGIRRALRSELIQGPHPSRYVTGYDVRALDDAIGHELERHPERYQAGVRGRRSVSEAVRAVREKTLPANSTAGRRADEAERKHDVTHDRGRKP